MLIDSSIALVASFAAWAMCFLIQDGLFEEHIDMRAGLQAVAEVDAPGAHDFMVEPARGALKRLLAFDCVQDPGNLVRLPELPLNITS